MNQSELKKKFEAWAENKTGSMSLDPVRAANQYAGIMSAWPLIKDLLIALEFYKLQGKFKPYHLTENDKFMDDYGQIAREALKKLNETLGESDEKAD